MNNQHPYASIGRLLAMTALVTTAVDVDFGTPSPFVDFLLLFASVWLLIDEILFRLQQAFNEVAARSAQRERIPID